MLKTQGPKPRTVKTANNIPIIIPTAHLDQQIAIVYKLLCCGLNRADILVFAKQNHWKEKELAIDGYIAAATSELAKAALVDVEAELGKSLERLNTLFQNASKVQDFKTALSIQKEINKVLELKIVAAGKAKPAGQSAEPRKGIALVK